MRQMDEKMGTQNRTEKEDARYLVFIFEKHNCMEKKATIYNNFTSKINVLTMKEDMKK